MIAAALFGLFSCTNACSNKIYVYINVTHPYELYFQEKFSFSSSWLSSSRIHVTNRKTKLRSEQLTRLVINL